MYTKIYQGEAAKQKKTDAANTVTNAVKGTLGANSHSTIYRKWNMPVSVNDGADILKKVFPYDAAEALVVEMLSQGSLATNELVADGTTSTALMSSSLVRQSINTTNPLKLQKELKEAGEQAVRDITRISNPIENDEQLLAVARVSSDDEDVSQIVVSAVRDAGETGRVVVEESKELGIKKESIEGMEIGYGFISDFMINFAKKSEAHLDDVFVLVTDRGLSRSEDLLPFVSEAKAAGCVNMLIIAKNVESAALKSLYDNKAKGVMNVVAIKTDLPTNVLEDIAAYTGATAVTSDKTVAQITIKHLGFLKKAVISRNKSLFIKAKLNETAEVRYAERVESLKEEAATDEKVKDRLARLTGKVVVVKVGTPTSSERHYSKMKIDDAIGSAQWALKEGFVPGGGTTLYAVLKEIAHNFGTEGSMYLYNAACEHLDVLAENAGFKLKGYFGYKGDLGLNRGFNVITNKWVSDMIGEGIVDSAAVLKAVITNAISTALPIIKSDNIIVEMEEKVDSDVESQN